MRFTGDCRCRASGCRSSFSGNCVDTNRGNGCNQVMRCIHHSESPAWKSHPVTPSETVKSRRGTFVDAPSSAHTSNPHLINMKRYLLRLASILAATTPLNLSAAIVYWDSNGNTTAGAGATPTGTWGTSLFWNTDSGGLGASATAGWTAGDTAVFSAGTDATGSYTVTVSGTQTAGGLNVEEGTVALATGTVSLGGGGIVISSGATLSTDCSNCFPSTFILYQ